MNKEYFLLNDKIEEIESFFKIENGWFKIYEREHISFDDSTGIYCCLVSNKTIKNYKKDYGWPILYGDEGKPTIINSREYKTQDKEGLEPFLFYKSFSLIDEKITYIDISEEFLLYFKLYEEVKTKNDRQYYYLNGYGELDKVIDVKENLIKIKSKYLKEYITIREMHLVVSFDIMRLIEKIPEKWKLKYKDELVEKENIIYNHLVRYVTGKTQSWIMGNVFIKPNDILKTHFDYDPLDNEEYIIGYDDNGDLLLENCGIRKGNHFKLTYFDKQVLDKYYNNPERYVVDGFKVSSKFFHLKIDNNLPDIVPVFIKDLSSISRKEQLHWKQYNIPPPDEQKISRSYYNTMIEGNWAQEPETVDLFFKTKYKSFNINWYNKFGWNLYKPLSKEDEYLFTSLHKITSNNVKSFCEQTLTIVKLTIDRLNEKQLSRNIILEEKERGLSKFEKFLASHEVQLDDMFTFLKNLQALRSGLIAHTFSKSNSSCIRAMKYFKIDGNNYQDVQEEIFIKSIYTLNTLERKFMLDKESSG